MQIRFRVKDRFGFEGTMRYGLEGLTLQVFFGVGVL